MTNDVILGFCPSCFADEESGSWEHVVIGNHCTNCGASNSIIQIPKWAVESIRRNASWVGRRYYPGEEDQEIQEERESLLNLVKTFPGRSAVEVTPGRWEVKQKKANGRFIISWISAQSEEEALRHCGLRYVPDEDLS